MKALLAFFTLTAAVHAQSPVVIYQPAPQATVVSPLTSPTSQSNQALLSQINSTIGQRYFEHQVLTLVPPTAPAVFTTATPTIRAR